MIEQNQLIDFLTKNRQIFFYFNNLCNSNYRQGDDLKFYRQIIEMHRAKKDFDSLLNDESLYPLIHKTLEKWNMNQRGAKLASINIIKNSIFEQRDNLSKLYNYKLHLINKNQINEILPLLSNVFNNLQIMLSKSRLVGVSKSLHFLLPDLIAPIDNRYTLFFINKSSNSNEFDTFKEIFIKFRWISELLLLKENDFDGNGCNTSIPKLIDNALIGFHLFFDKNRLETVILEMEKFIKIDSDEKNSLRRLLENNLSKLPTRKKIKEKILIEKAMKAGITVSDEEVKAEMAKRKKT